MTKRKKVSNVKNFKTKIDKSPQEQHVVQPRTPWYKKTITIIIGTMTLIATIISAVADGSTIFDRFLNGQNEVEPTEKEIKEFMENYSGVVDIKLKVEKSSTNKIRYGFIIKNNSQYPLKNIKTWNNSNIGLTHLQFTTPLPDELPPNSIKMVDGSIVYVDIPREIDLCNFDFMVGYQIFKFNKFFDFNCFTRYFIWKGEIKTNEYLNSLQNCEPLPLDNFRMSQLINGINSVN